MFFTLHVCRYEPVGGGNYLAIFHSLTWRKRCNSPKRQRNAQQLYWEPETPQPTLVTKQESHITVWEKHTRFCFFIWKKTHTRFFNPTSKTHPRFFLPSKNTYAFLILNSRHIRVFGFDSKNTSAFFFSSKKTHARFFISLRDKKTHPVFKV